MRCEPFVPRAAFKNAPNPKGGGVGAGGGTAKGTRKLYRCNPPLNKLLPLSECRGFSIVALLVLALVWGTEKVLRIAKHHPKPSQELSELSGLQKGPAENGPRQKSSKIVKKRQKVFRHFSTIFAQGKKRQKSSESVKKFFDTFRQFSRGTIFPAPFGGRL